MSISEQTASFCVNLCLANQLARVFGESQARAITKCARRVRDSTKDTKLYELAKMYSRDLAPVTVDSRRITGDEAKVMSVNNLHKGMISEGVL